MPCLDFSLVRGILVDSVRVNFKHRICHSCLCKQSTAKPLMLQIQLTDLFLSFVITASGTTWVCLNIVSNCFELAANAHWMLLAEVLRLQTL